MTRATAAEMLEDAFPHSTPEGYERGCRGSKCRGIEDYGWSCTYAMQQYRGDYHYRQWVDAGKGPGEISRLREGLADQEAASKKGARSEAAPLITAPTVTVADSREPVRERPKPRPVPNPAANVRPVKEIEEVVAVATEEEQEVPAADVGKHGTYYGYQKGCRGDHALTCPSKVAGGVSCYEANLKYQREWRARKRAKKVAAAAATPKPVEPERVETFDVGPVVVGEPAAASQPVEPEQAEVPAALEVAAPAVVEAVADVLDGVAIELDVNVKPLPDGSVDIRIRIPRGAAA